MKINLRVLSINKMKDLTFDILLMIDDLFIDWNSIKESLNLESEEEKIDK